MRKTPKKKKSSEKDKMKAFAVKFNQELDKKLSNNEKA